MNSQPQNPFEAVGQSLQNLQHAVNKAASNLQQAVAHHVHGASQQLLKFQQDVATHLQQAQQRHLQQPRHLFAAASINQGQTQRTSNAQGSKPKPASSSDARRPTASSTQPLAQLSYNAAAIGNRLSGIPVYTVTGQDDSIVLISGEGSSQNLGLFFFSEGSARAMLEKMKTENPDLAARANVQMTTMDKVYDYACAPREDGTMSDVSFRFVPDVEQVKAAVQLGTQKVEGLDPAADFVGVPLFQAEGLTVKGANSTYTPLFFSKGDLDIALSKSLAQQRTPEAEKKAKHELAKAKTALQEAEQQLAAAKRKEQAEAQSKVAAARKHVVKANRDLRRLVHGPPIEVGCFEEVIMHLENVEDDSLNDIMFVPAGAVANPTPPSPPQKEQKKKGWFGRGK